MSMKMQSDLDEQHEIQWHDMVQMVLQMTYVHKYAL